MRVKGEPFLRLPHVYVLSCITAQTIAMWEPPHALERPWMDARCSRLASLSDPFSCGHQRDCRDSEEGANFTKGNYSKLNGISKCMKSHEPRCEYDNGSLRCTLPGDHSQMLEGHYKKLYPEHQLNRPTLSPGRPLTISTDCSTNETNFYWYEQRCEKYFTCGDLTDDIVCIRNEEKDDDAVNFEQDPSISFDAGAVRTVSRTRSRRCLHRIRKIFANHSLCDTPPIPPADCSNDYFAISMFIISVFYGGVIGAIGGYFRSLDAVPVIFGRLDHQVNRCRNRSREDGGSSSDSADNGKYCEAAETPRGAALRPGNQSIVS